jgi:hypothetical protein
VTSNSLLVFERRRESLLATAFPTGTLRVERYEDWLARDAIGTSAASGQEAHPAWILLGALRSAGLTLDEIVEAGGGTWDAGVMFGETRLELDAPLRPGVDYRVEARFVDLQQRHGRTIGPFDLMTYQVSLLDGDRRVARCTNSFVMRREAAP